MKYAIINGKKKEAYKGGRGFCQMCNSELIAKCGDIKINHWAHISMRNCDVWWENETKWHRHWKDFFPKEWQEVVHFDCNGEKHIADVKTSKNWVIEFQHSFIKKEERLSRIDFYSKMIWIVDGLRRKTDLKQFLDILKYSNRIPFGNYFLLEIHSSEGNRLLKEWNNCGVPVFFDFSEANPLWFLLPLNLDKVYLAPFNRNELIRILKNDEITKLLNVIILELSNFVKKR